MAFVFFALGAILASFTDVLAGRLSTGQGIVGGRSRCDACGRALSARDLVPVLSYIALRGRARCCGARLSPVVPLAELLLGALFALAYHALGVTLALLFFLLALVFLAALVRYDLTHQVLPLPFLAGFIGAAVVARALLGGFALSLGIALGIALFLAAIHLFSRGRAMGLADAPLAFGLALLSGPAALAGFIYSFWIGALIGIILLARRPRGSRMGVEVPFAPFLAAGFLLATFLPWNLFIFAASP